MIEDNDKEEYLKDKDIKKIEKEEEDEDY
jgi:hypothetical protein